MQNDFNLRWLPTKNVCQDKMYLSKSKMTPPQKIIKILPRKIFSQLISYTEYTEHVRFYLPLPPASVTVSIFTVSAFIFLTHILNIPIVFTVVP